MHEIFITISQSKMFQLLAILIIMDVVFGCLRAVKEKSFNSTVGINGLIRKGGMFLCCICLVFVDNIISLDLIGFIPDAIKSYLPIEKIDIMSFFAVIFCIYEVLSVLKNMALSGLPVNKIWKKLSNFLKTNTGEIIDETEVEENGGSTEEDKLDSKGE